jgi:hypothetical protein
MASVKNRLERLEREQSFQAWLRFQRFLEGLTYEQLEAIAVDWRFPELLPEPLPTGGSRLDGLARSALLKLWEDSERQTACTMREIASHTKDELRFYLHHGHWPEYICGMDCLDPLDKQISALGPAGISTAKRESSIATKS